MDPVTGKVNTRDAFFATLTGSTILSSGIARTDGVIKKLFGNVNPSDRRVPDVSRSDEPVVRGLPKQAAQTPESPRPAQLVEQDAIPVGLAYEIYRIGSDGAEVLVPPNQLSFRTGERFVVLLMANVPGVVDAFNIDDQGVTKHLGKWLVGGAEPVRLPPVGAFQFTNLPGIDELQLQLFPCRGVDVASNGIRKGVTRSIAVDERVVHALPSCASSGNRSVRYAPTRGIEVDLGGSTGIAVKMYSQAELASVDILPQVVRILFVHEKNKMPTR